MPYRSATAATWVARSGLFGGKRSSRCRNCRSESTGMTLCLLFTVSQCAIHCGTTNTQPPRNFCCAQLFFETKSLNFGGIDRWLAAAVNATRFCGSNAFNLTLTPEIGFKLGKNAQHVQESFTRCTAGVNRLLCGL